MEELIYIEPTDVDIKFYKEIIKEQRCRDSIDVQVIHNKINTFVFGYISISNKYQSNRRNIKKPIDKYILNGFILCSFNKELDSVLDIDLVCSRKNSKIGKLLMNTVEEYAKSIGIDTLVLHSLAEENLKKWYKDLGFVHISTVYLKEDTPKVFFMMKKI